MNYCVFNNIDKVGIEVPIKHDEYNISPIRNWVRKHMTFIPEELWGNGWDYSSLEDVKSWNYKIIYLPKAESIKRGPRWIYQYQTPAGRHVYHKGDSTNILVIGRDSIMIYLDCERSQFVPMTCKNELIRPR